MSKQHGYKDRFFKDRESLFNKITQIPNSNFNINFFVILLVVTLVIIIVKYI